MPLREEEADPGVPRTTPATTTATDEPLSPTRGSFRSPCPLSLHLERRHVFTPTHTPISLLVAASAFWGIGTVLSKLALDRGIPPVTLLAVEMGASSTFLLLALLVTTRLRPRITLTVDLRRLVALGALNPALGYALGLLGPATVSASLAVLVWAIEPVIVVLLAVPLLAERPERRTVALVLVAVAGRRGGSSGPWNQRPARRHPLDSGRCSRLCAVHRADPPHAPRRWLPGRGAGPAAARLRARPAGTRRRRDHRVVRNVHTDRRSDSALAAASGVVYYALAYVCYVAALRQVPAAVAGRALPLIPVWGLAAAFLAGDRLSPAQWLGAAIVGLAVLAVALTPTSGSISTTPARAGQV